MILNNYKNLVATVLQSEGGNATGLLKVKATDGVEYYACAVFDGTFPDVVVNDVVRSATDPGIVLGTGTTPVTALDYKIQTALASGFTAEVITQRTTDLNNNPYLKLKISVTNAGSSTLTIHEIAYNQTVTVTETKGGTEPVKRVVCLDHTVFDNDVNIPAGETRLINYLLKTVQSGSHPILMSKSISRNGVFTPDEGYDGFSAVTVNVSTPAVVSTLTATANGVYSASDRGFDGFSVVTVSVPMEFSASDDGRVVYQGFLSSQTSSSITENGIYNTMFNDVVNVNVQTPPPHLEGIQIRADGQYYPSDYDCEGFSEVEVLTGVGDPGMEDAFITRVFGSSYSNSRVSSVGPGAFYSASIRNLTLDNVTTIKSCAFMYAKVSSLSLPAVTTVNTSGFYRLATSLISLPNCTTIQSNAFYNCDASKIVVPNVTSIPVQAFLFCQMMSEVDVTAATVLANAAFSGCNKLQTLSLPNCSAIGPYAVYGCGKLTSVYIPSVKTISSNAFSGCSILTSVYMPNVETISAYAFAGCYSLPSVDLPKVTSVEYSTFYYCSALEEVNIPSCTSIGSYAFYKTKLSTVSFPAVEFVGGSAFAYCLSLQNVSMSECKYLSTSAFCGCSTLNSISLPKLTIMSSWAFGYCYSLSQAVLASMTEMGGSAFYSCTSLALFSAPVLRIVGTSAFYNCSVLASVSIPVCVSIYEGAFNGCSSLSVVELPECLSVGGSAFSRCISLESLYLLASSVARISSNAFYSTPMVNSSYLGHFGSIYVPASLLSLYQASSSNSAFSARFAEYSEA